MTQPICCKWCLAELTAENTYHSFIEHGFKCCKKCDKQQAKNLYSNRRENTKSRLGGKCACCGINNPCFLSIDHIYGGGHKEAEDVHWKHFMRNLDSMSDEDLLAKYRCLCFNCNYARGFWHACPHNFSTEEIPENTLIIGNRGRKNTNLPESEYKARELNLRKILNLKYRLEMIVAYGGECAICGENGPLFLVIDHINNNGKFDSKGMDFYSILNDLGYPGKGTQLQLLCHNCNAKKEYTDNRKNKSLIIKNEAEIYIKQPYQISKEEDDRLWHEARVLFAKISKAIKS